MRDESTSSSRWVGPGLGFLGLALAGGGLWALLDGGPLATGLPVMLTGLGLWLASLFFGDDDRHLGRYPSMAWKVAPLALIALMACFLRFSQLATFPDGINHDSSWNGIEAAAFLDGRPYEAFSLRQHGRETFYFLLIAAAFRFTGETVFGIRLTSAVIGILGVYAIYFAGRKLYSEGVGLLAAAFAAASVPHIVLSRMGFRAILLPTVSAAAVAALVVALRKRSFGWGAGAGLLLGLCCHTYTAGRLVAPIGMLVGGIFLVTDWRFFKRQAAVLAVTAACFVVALGPLIHYHFTEGEIIGREQNVNVGRFIIQEGNFEPLLRNVRQVALMFHWRADRGHIYPRDMAMLRYLPGLFLALGLAVCLRHIGRKEHIGLLCWASGMSLGGILSLEPNINRLAGLYPCLWLLMALGASALLQTARRAAGASLERPLYPFAAVGLCLVMSFTADRHVFQRLAEAPDFRFSFFGNMYDVGLRAQELADTHLLYMSPHYGRNDTVRFLNYRVSENVQKHTLDTGIPAYPEFDPMTMLPLATEGDKGVAIFVEGRPENLETVPRLIKSFYPMAQTERLQREGMPFPPTLVYVVSSEEIRSLMGLRLTAEDGSVLPGMPEVIPLPLEASPRSRVLSGSLRLSGAIKLERDFYGALSITGLPGSFLLVDGAIMAPGEARFLTAGLHAIEVIFQGPPEGRVELRIRPDGGQESPFPTSAIFNFEPEPGPLRGLPAAPSPVAFRKLPFQAARPGPGPEGVRNPNDVTVAPDGAIYIATKETNKVKVYSPEGQYLREWGTRGNSGASFGPFQSIEFANGQIYMTDIQHSAILRFSPEGELLQRLDLPVDTEPSDIAVNAMGDMFIVNRRAGTLVGLRPDGYEFLRWTGEGTELGRLVQPVTVALDPQGRIWLADATTMTIACVTPEGELVTHWQVAGIHLRSHLDCDERGILYLTLSRSERALLMDDQGRMLYDPRPELRHRPLGEVPLREPTGIDVVGDRVYILDSTADTAVVMEVAGN